MEKLYTVKELSEMLSLKERTIQAKLRNGVIKGYKMGRLWRINPQEIERIRKGDNKNE